MTHREHITVVRYGSGTALLIEFIKLPFYLMVGIALIYKVLFDITVKLAQVVYQAWQGEQGEAVRRAWRKMRAEQRARQLSSR